MNGGWGISYEIALRWMPLDLTDEKSTLVQVMAWCHQATSHYLSQCWPRSMSPYGVTRPQWVEAPLCQSWYKTIFWRWYRLLVIISSFNEEEFSSWCTLLRIIIYQHEVFWIWVGVGVGVDRGPDNTPGPEGTEDRYVSDNRNLW